jgi:electron transfer flavoprotein alpha subunit
LALPFAQECIDLALSDSGGIAVTRPVYGGNAMAVFRFNGTGPQIMAIRPNIFEFEGDASGSAEIVEIDVSEAVGDVRSRLLETVAEERQGIRLEDADLVVSGGRGLGGPEPFERLQQLADALNGAVGASRAACDAGWIDHGNQIGLTGKSISPRVYITWGISGASQHMAGCSGAKSIVAVNTDPDANIFREARFGVVGNWDKVLTGFAAAVQELTGS